ncbi:MAG: Uncharacterized protein Greene041662_165 [Candidatus Peregrinibacteria bacterium Greene0416_62]|nr:MAG: Uncharacterized protein Greene041662_165 [Candidatus Peregrinibacteria bacterium Greene0416_62]TSD00754.1 MAG: Uncharacterized protein Greene101449_17 [Candidatus Peregrinibacteria bacterium Greene1014_49]
MLISMEKTCTITGKPFTISESEQAFIEAMDMPLPTIEPEERIRQLMATRNEWKLYHRTCDATGSKILSAYPPESPYTVYRNDVWWGDSWEGLTYGKPFDFSKSFFAQFDALQKVVPREGTSVFQSENCDYNSHIRQSKNCYLNSLVVRAEDMYYSYWMVDVENVIDCCFHIKGKSALCYECLAFGTCVQGIALQECYNCNDCAFCYDLRGCDHCLLCSNLSHKSYHILNKPCSREAYEKLRSEMINGSYASWVKAYQQYAEVRQNALHRAAHTINCENVTGDHLFDSKNCLQCFDGDTSEDCSNDVSLNDAKDIHSCYSAGWPRCEQLYNCAVSRGCSAMAFCRYMWFCNDMRYCDSCQSCKHCFGCTGLRHKDYCILNVQYSKEEYEALLPKIIAHMKSRGEWGHFWPYTVIPFAYNETSAQTYFPLTKAEALKRGFRWRDEKDAPPDVTKIVPADRLPDSIDEIPDDVLGWAIECAVTKRPFRIIKQELDFYRRMRLPLPRIHPEERHLRRMALRNSYTLWERACGNCKKAIQTTYSPERTEKIVCAECYLKAVY